MEKKKKYVSPGKVSKPMSAANYYKSTRVLANSGKSGLGYGGEKPKAKKVGSKFQTRKFDNTKKKVFGLK